MKAWGPSNTAVSRKSAPEEKMGTKDELATTFTSSRRGMPIARRAGIIQASVSVGFWPRGVKEPKTRPAGSYSRYAGIRTPRLGLLPPPQKPSKRKNAPSEKLEVISI